MENVIVLMRTMRVRESDSQSQEWRRPKMVMHQAYLQGCVTVGGEVLEVEKRMISINVEKKPSIQENCLSFTLESISRAIHGLIIY